MEVSLADVLSFLLFLFGSYICGWWWFNGAGTCRKGDGLGWDGMEYGAAEAFTYTHLLQYFSMNPRPVRVGMREE